MNPLYTLLLLILSGATLHAQIDTTGRWFTSDAGSRSVLTKDDFRGVYLTVRDSLHLFGVGHRADDPGHPIGSTDGGVTWSDVPRDEWIHTRITDQVSVAPGGLISRDAGATWTRIEFPSNDTGSRCVAISAVGNAPAFIAVQYQRYVPDPNWGVRPVGPLRLAFSTDAGEGWVFADSTEQAIDQFGWEQEVIADTTFFGPYPRTDSSNRLAWQQNSMTMFDSSHLIIQAGGNPRFPTERLIAHFDLVHHTARWLFFQHQVTWVSSSVGFAAVWNGAIGPKYLRTMNGGESWDTLATPAWLAAELQFHTPALFTAMNGVSTDGGGTWQRQNNPFGRTPLFADATHRYFTNGQSFFARSSDAGRSWSYSFGSADVYALAAHDGRVVVARRYRSLSTLR